MRRSDVRRIEVVMGTVASVHVYDVAESYEQALNIENALDSAFAELERLEEMFSTFRATSEISRVNRCELKISGCSREVGDILDSATWLEHVSNGAFSVWTDDPRRPIDPAGLVKGWATERAADIVTAAGVENFTFAVGGDLCLRGVPPEGGEWRVAVTDPVNPGGVLGWVETQASAIATSGTAERGRHIRDPRRSREDHADPAWSSISVWGPSLTWADAFATTVFVMGETGLDWIRHFPDYQVLAVCSSGEVVAPAPTAGRFLR